MILKTAIYIMLIIFFMTSIVYSVEVPPVTTVKITNENENRTVDVIRDPKQIRRLAVDARIPVMTTGYRAIYNSANFNLLTDYLAIISLSGSGNFWGFIVKGNSDQIVYRLEVDGVTSFEMTAKDLKDGRQACDKSVAVKLHFCGIGNEVYFYPDIPIYYETSLVVSAKRSGSRVEQRTHVYEEF